MIKTVNGNLLEAEVDALVNTVNTVGVMGKGIALQFKQAFPANYAAYERACRAKQVQLGSMFVFDNGGLTKPKYIINFPTKKHWRSKSRIGDIRAGLTDLVRVIRKYDIRSIAVPPLGSGSGGLNWDDVRPLIEKALKPLTEVDVLIYPPEGAPNEQDMPVATSKPAMTSGRAVLLRLMHHYLPRAEAVDGVSQVEIQKLMYFMQAAGQDLKLQYSKGSYGPYADNLNHVLRMLEGHYLRGFGDRTRKVSESSNIRLLPGAAEEAAAFLEADQSTGQRFDEVLGLVDGFESPYGLELLATVHWLGTIEDSRAAEDSNAAVKLVLAWSRRKARLFTERHIEFAWRRLHSARPQDWFERPAVAMR